MLRSLIERPVATIMLVAGLLLFGAIAVFLLPVSSLPDIEYPTIRVEASLPGASAETMAKTVTTPLEEQFGAVFELKSMLSTSEPGSSVILLSFPVGHNMLRAGSEVQAAISRAQPDLPPLPALPIWYFDNPSEVAVLVLAFTSDEVTPTALDRFADEALKRQARTIPGVRIVIDYVRQREAFRVEINPDALASHQLTLADVRHALQDSNVDQPKGRLDAHGTSAFLAANDQLITTDDIASTVIAFRNGGPVLVKDVARVWRGPEEETNAFGTFNGRPAVAFGLRRSPQANVLQTIENIKQRLPDIRASLPPGIHVEVAVDRSLAIRAAVSEVELTLLLTTVLVVASIFLFLRRLWATVIPSIAIPLSLAATFAGMYLLGFSINNLTLMALTVAVGFVVDDAIVVLENIARHIEEGKPAKDAAIVGVREVAFTIGSITLSLVAVFIPVMFMGGLVGELFRQFGITITVALLASGIVSLTITPVLCGYLLRPEPKDGGQRRAPHPMRARATAAIERLAALAFQGYSKSLDWVIARRGLMLAVLACIVIATVYLYIASPKGFLPKQDTGIFRGNVVADSQVSAREKARLIDIVVEHIRRSRNVLRVLSYGSGSMFIELVPPDLRTNSMDQIAAELRAAGTIAGVTFYLSSIPELPINSWVGRGDYQLSLTDNSSTELQTWSTKLVDRLQQLPELVDVTLDQHAYLNELKLNINRDMAAKLGIRVADIDDALQDAFGEHRVKAVHADSGKVYVIMQLDRSVANSESVLQKISVTSSQGSMVPISTFSSIDFSRTPAAVQHKGQLPAMSVSFNLAPDVSIGTAVAAIHTALEQSGKPVTLQYSMEGTAGEFERSLASQPWLIAGALLVMYLLLGVLYESFLHPITILSSLPPAGLGALIFLRAANLDLSIIAVVGMLLLIGIAKKNAIMIVDFALHAERSGAAAASAIKQACLIRIRPIMMTTFAALFGALPLVFASGPGFELRRPLGVSIVGGLLISQILTLYSTPVVYLVIGDAARAVRARLRPREAGLEGAPSSVAADTTVSPANSIVVKSSAVP